MRITAFNGSPNGRNGNTNIIVEQFLLGARDSAMETENIPLSERKIKLCRGCLDCWFKSPGRCILDDDAPTLINKFLESDIAVFATPVYVDNVTGLMKAFLDRFVSTVHPHFIDDGHGECRHPLRFQNYPKLVVISSCGFPEMTHFQVVELYFRRLARNLHTDVIGEIYRTMGPILTAGIPVLAPIIKRYKKLVRNAGKEIAETHVLSRETRIKLEKNLIPRKIYIKGINNSFDKILGKIGEIPPNTD